MRIVVIDGHSDAGGYCDAVARSYVDGGESGGETDSCLLMALPDH